MPSITCSSTSFCKGSRLRPWKTIRAVSALEHKHFNLRFADDTDGLTGEQQELVNVVEFLDKISTAYRMEIDAVKTKLMTNKLCVISTEVKVNDWDLKQ